MTAISMAEIVVAHAQSLSIFKIVHVLENTLERPKTILFLKMAFAKMTLTMNNAIMMALIAAH
jgi:hypothetical protein